MEKIKLHFLSIAIMTVMVILAGCSVEPLESKRLNASVSFISGTQFLITNNDSYAWNYVDLRINHEYTLKVGRIDAGSSYTVDTFQFADSSGQRFNIFKTKLQSLYISNAINQYSAVDGDKIFHFK